jgi:hypothetical protein
MSALGQKRTSRHVHATSALPPKADMVQRDRDVRFVPKADSCTAARTSLFDHVVGALPQEQRHVEAERLGGFQIDH